jgi:hypothetical protein
MFSGYKNLSLSLHIYMYIYIYIHTSRVFSTVRMILGTFSKEFRKESLRYICKSVCLSVRTEQLGSQWSIFVKFYFEDFYWGLLIFTFGYSKKIMIFYARNFICLRHRCLKWRQTSLCVVWAEAEEIAGFLIVTIQRDWLFICWTEQSAADSCKRTEKNVHAK